MCDPVSMAIVGSAVGYAGSAGAIGTALAGAAVGGLAGAAAKKAMPKAPSQAPQQAPTQQQEGKLPETQGPKSAMPRATGGSGASKAGGFGSGFGSTLLTGSRGVSPLEGALGKVGLKGGAFNTILGG